MSGLTAYHHERNAAAQKSVDEMAKHPLSAEEKKAQIARRKAQLKEQDMKDLKQIIDERWIELRDKARAIRFPNDKKVKLTPEQEDEVYELDIRIKELAYILSAKRQTE